MKLLFITLLLLLAAVILALYARQAGDDPGYVLIQLWGWSIEMSAVLLIVIALLAFLLLYFVLRSVGGAWRMPRRWRAWRLRRRQRHASDALTRGYLDLIEGRWDRAEQQLLRYAGEEAGVLGFLGAARAAQAQGANIRRDRYLQLACKLMPNREFALALAQADMQIADSQYEPALANLKRLHGMAPKNHIVLTQLMRLYTHSEDWERLLELAPTLRKRRVINPDRCQRMELRAWIGLLEASARVDESTLHATWKRAPRAFRDSEEMLGAYVQHLLGFGAGARAEDALFEAIGRHWNARMVYLYGLVEGVDPAIQLRRAEGWLRGRENDVVVLLTLGRLCRRNGLWGKARHYLEACVKAGGPAEACSELAATLEAMGETDAALEYYRRGMLAMEADSHRQALQGSDLQRLMSPS